jgi:hypothetical protein
MKKIIGFFSAAVIMIAFATNVNAQVSANALASATIVTPIAIAWASDMNFGNVGVDAAGGTVDMTPAGVRTANGGCFLPAVTGTVTAGSFTVSGTGGATYSITLPGAALTISNGANNMSVDTWTSTPTPTGTIGGGGTQTLSVGATLHVGGSQAPGLYTSAAPGFTVTVNYN